MNSQGFTLVELLVVIAILGIILAVSIPSFSAFTKSQYLAQSAEQVLGDLRSAQSKAQNGVVDGSNACWGLEILTISSSSYNVGSVACGTTCGTALSNVRPVNFSGVVKSSNSGVQRVVFNKISGLPVVNANCATTLTMILDGVTKSVIIEAGGNMYVQ